MSVPQHKIMRQVVELRGCPRAAAQRLQSELRDAYRERLLPLIEKTCSELSPPGRIHRIETLEIDLGEVPLEALESGIAGKFEARFARKLAAAIDAAPEADSELELIACFIRTGTVPWWAEASDPRLLQSALEILLGRAPEALRRMIQAAPDPQRARIVRAYPDRLLEELAGVVAPPLRAACPGLGAAWMTMLDSASSLGDRPASAARHVFWEEVLRAAADGDAAGASGFSRAVLTRVAQRMALEYRSLVADLHGALEHDAGPSATWIRDVVKSLWRELGGDPREAAPPSEAGLMQLLERLETASAPDGGLWAQLRAVSGRLPARLRAQAAAAYEAARGGEALSSATVDALAALARYAVEQHLVAPVLLERARLLDAIRQTAPGPRQKEAHPDTAFSDADAVYVGNAGLVILWPFLSNFFARLGLTEEKAFKDPAAVQRAVGLLQYLATGEAPGPEHLVPLNKVLCGMALEEVFDFGPEITDEEIEACNDLVGAVIHQAPILRDMSIGGFRASFLLRNGQLGSRDGHWLLRVERETHDIVLDRFPWSVHVVKLPWMQALMQVEW